jgi:hypothetical protein
MSQDTKAMETWASLRDELRKLRGMNRFRGNEEHLLARKEVRLIAELRAGRPNTTYFVLHLTDSLAALWAEEFPGGRKITVDDYAGDWRAWLGAIVDACRGAHYLHTSSAQADYRHDSKRKASN